MNVLQCLLLALFGSVSALFSPWLMHAGWLTLGRPLIAGTVVGLILGDLTTGILLGCAVQTLYIGLVTPGGSMPADVNYVAWIGIPLTMIVKADAAFALALSPALSFLGVLATLLTVTINSFFVHRQDSLIGRGKLESAMRIPIIGQVSNFIVRFFPIFLFNYFGQGLVQQLYESIPIEVIGILAGFGNVLPLVGFAILLKLICKRNFDLIYYLVGFVLVAVMKFPIVPVLIFAALFAYLDFRYSASDEQAVVTPLIAKPEKTEERLLNKKDVFSCCTSWVLWNLSVQNLERMQAPAVIRMVGLVKDKLYPNDREKQQALLARHEPFFNTEPFLGSIVPGVILGMEEENARSQQGVPDELIAGVKTALMGPMAGIGDSLYIGTLIPILLAIAIGMSSSSGSIVGPLFYIVAHLGIMMPVTWLLFFQGYNMGLSAATTILGGGIKDRITQAMSIVGLTIVGAITCEYVTIRTGWVMMQGEEVMLDMNAALDGIFPNVITLLLALLVYWLMAKKNVKIGWMFLLLFVFAVVALLTGLMAL